MDALARELAASHDMDEIDRLARERAKLDEPWVFVPR
jgi:hypothetical protein